MVTAESGQPSAPSSEGRNANGMGTPPPAPSIRTYDDLMGQIVRLSSSGYLCKRVRLMSQAGNGSSPVTELEGELLEAKRRHHDGDPIDGEVLATFQRYWVLMNT